MIFAPTRHATFRAGDPCPHDHVLVDNVIRMADAQGGWKAADTALWREHLHAATMVGRMAAAHEAVALGCGIEADDGSSGCLGHWAISGIPTEVTDAPYKRAAEIQAPRWSEPATTPTRPATSPPAPPVIPSDTWPWAT